MTEHASAHTRETTGVSLTHSLAQSAAWNTVQQARPENVHTRAATSQKTAWGSPGRVLRPAFVPSAVLSGRRDRYDQRPRLPGLGLLRKVFSFVCVGRVFDCLFHYLTVCVPPYLSLSFYPYLHAAACDRCVFGGRFSSDVFLTHPVDRFRFSKGTPTTGRP